MVLSLSALLYAPSVTSSAAADGVGALLSAAKSDMGQSISCPTGAYKQSVSDEWIAANPTSLAFIEGANYATTVVPEGLGVYMGEFRDIVLRHMEQVLLNDADPQAELDAAQAEVLEIIK